MASLLFTDAIATEDIPQYFVPPPPFSEGIFPCSECHKDMEVNTNRRELSFHEDIKLKHHAEEQRWCLDCHNPHQPRFKPLEPLPPPIRPEDIKYRKLTEENIPLNPINSISEKVYSISEKKLEDNDAKTNKK